MDVDGRPQSRRIAASVTLVLLLAMGTVSACGSDDSSAVASTEPVVRVQLGASNPQNAPGQELFLEQVTIAPGARLSTHYHQGTQVAHVVSGELTYNIVSGTATVLRGSGDGQVQELATGPTVVVIKAGDGVVETEDVVHYGSNDGDVPLVIMLAALLADGAPMATAVDAPVGSGTNGG
jgi:quercetin dioxygenase-like cupin family protein